MRYYLIVDHGEFGAYVAAELNDTWIETARRTGSGRVVTEGEAEILYPEQLVAWRRRDDTSAVLSEDLVAARRGLARIGEEPPPNVLTLS